MNKQLIALAAVLLTVASGSLGFGISQMKSTGELQGEVREHRVEIQQIKLDAALERKRTDERIFEVVELVRTVIRSNESREATLRDFVNLLKVQNELLQRQRQ